MFENLKKVALVLLFLASVTYLMTSCQKMSLSTGAFTEQSENSNTP